uniref:NAD-dependent epimerase/dehydratase domain-containing protein n=1 Tax=Oryza meridionalis TaxID=40149 RepID=A0A0E0DIQ8_9ORYZ
MSAVVRKTACVTGGNGYIASALIKMLLEKGYAVNTTVRNPENTEKNSHFKELHALGPLTVFRADLEEEGSFDEAVAGCDYAFLVAAPVNLKSENPQKELVEAGVRGTLNVMRSCVRAGTVRRVVLTSSAAAVSGRPLQGDGHVLVESSWSDVDYLSSAANKKSPGKAYSLSKVLSEKEASRVAEENGISLVTVCPVVTVGPAPAVEAKPCVAAVLSLLSGDEEMISTVKIMEKASGGLMLVHVDDLCRAEIFLAEKPPPPPPPAESFNTTVLALARFMAGRYPQYSVKTDRFDGMPEKPRVCCSSEKLIREGFEFKYTNMGDILDDLVEYGRALGILPH